MKVHILTTGSTGDYKPVIKMFEDHPEYEVLQAPLDVELVVFCGGSDVSPHLYGEVNEGESYCNPARDQAEKIIYDAAVQLGIPMVGICRGGQFLNVMNGGKMIQDLPEFHSGRRLVEIWSDQIRTVPLHEDHHQGMIPHESGNILGIDAIDGNAEIVVYRETKCLCFQAHPEWGDDETREIFFGLLDKHIRKV